MSDILTKSGVPGSPYVAPVPADPGHPAQPAYTAIVSEQVPVYYVPPEPGGVGTFLANGLPGGDTITNPGYWYLSLPPGPLTPGVPIFVGYTTVFQTVNFPAQPAVAPSPAQPGAAARPYDFQIGWNSGAVSLSPLSGNGEYQFSIPANVVGVVTGLAPTDVQGNYVGIQWGMYFHSGELQIIENGSFVGYLMLSYNSSDVFSIVVLGGVVTYWQNSSLLYTSTVAPVGALYANAAMFMAADAVDNAAFVTPVSSSFYPSTISVAGVLGPVIGNASNLPGGWCAGTLTGLTVPPYTYVSGSLTPVSAYFCTGGGFTEDCEGVLTPLSGGGTANLIVPQYAICSCSLTPLSDFAYAAGVTGGTCAGVLTPLTAFATNLPHSGWVDNGNIPSLVSYCSANMPRPNYFDGWGYSDPAAFESAGGYNLFAQASQDVDVSYGFNGELSGYSFTALAGARAPSLTVSDLTLSASGTVTILGEAVLQLSESPLYQLMASATGQTMGRAYLTYDGWTVYGLCGAIEKTELSGYTVSAHGAQGALGEARLAIGKYHYGFSASGTQRNFGVVQGTLTSVDKANGALFVRAAPYLRLVATGHSPATYTSEAYSFTLVGDGEQITEVRGSHYTEYPFNQIVRFGNTYYGIGSSGIYSLDGSTFNGDPILSVIKTGESDLGEPTLKRSRYLWLGGRVSADLTVTVSAKELTNNTYTYAATGAGSGKWRVVLGKGIETVYLAYTIQNTDGDDFLIQEMGPDVDVLRRSA